ncbi:LPXTG cell wall anchor domain-containing protein [Paenibacillus sp. NFR01]|uniref:LPXTG cell wall anchor domain-containing protein n=1 Tax=Paenibacillus sp. NFR01 TaxID=1566279 RepID=UPI0008AD0469|nr:LPXTG cell wall anchor domain-containing protein [Paenibacillus sp. NFR01]SET92878.1 LPXTG-motif cell wall anchor domain-containing protein [Paenibacillus sp. NFR01]
MMKRNFAAILSFLIIMLQVTYGFGFAPRTDAAEIKNNIISSVNMTVYDNGVPVTDAVYKQGAEVKLTYDWQLPDKTYQGGDTYTFDLPDHFVLASDISGIPLKADGMTLGRLDVRKGNPNQATLTFGDDVDKYFDVHGSFAIRTAFDKASFTETTVQRIVFPVNGGNKTVTVRFVPDVPSTIAKSGTPVGANKDHYNAAAIDWTVDVNKTLASVNGAEITDPIPAGLAVNIDSVKVYLLDMKLNGSAVRGKQLLSSEYTASLAGGKLKIGFSGAPITGAYRLEYTTDLTDAGKTSFTNTASFSGRGMTAATATAKVTVASGSPLAKTFVSYDPANRISDWEIRYNYNERIIAQADAVLKDVFDSSQTLVPGSLNIVPVSFSTSVKGTEGKSPFTNYTLNPPAVNGAGKSGFELRFNQDVSGAYLIKYKTQALNRVEEETTVKNTVSSGSSTATDSGKLTPAIIGKKVAATDYAAKTVTWEVTIDGDSYPMNQVSVKDSFTNKGLKLVPGSIVVKKGGSTLSSGYSLSNVEETKGFEVKFASALAGPYTIIYKTYFDNQWLNYDWLKTTAKFENAATVKWSDAGSSATKSKTASAVFTPNSKERANGFKSGDYNAATKEITWTIGVNYNRSELNNAKVTDVLESGQAYVAGSLSVYPMTVEKDGDAVKGTTKIVPGKVYTVTYDEGGKQLEVAFSGKIQAGYYLVFKTSLGGKAVDSPEIDNTARLSSGNGKESRDLNASVDIPNAGQFIDKTGVQNNTKIKWSVNINYSQSYIENAVITDYPTDNQLLLGDSFKLYPATVSADGKVTKGSKPLVQGTDYRLDIQNDAATGKQQFTLAFLAPIEKPYVLEYESLIVAKDNDKVSNSVQLSGNSSITITKEKKYEVTVALSAAEAVGTGSRKALKLIKTDAQDGSKLAGATFALYRDAGTAAALVGTVTTDVYGAAAFGNLWPGSYYLQEVEAPEGYVIQPDPVPVAFNSTTETTLTLTNEKAQPSTSPSPTPEAPATATPAPTAAPTPEAPATATPAPTAAPTPEAPATATPAPSAAPTPEAPATATPAPSVAPTPETPATATPTPTAAPTPEAPATAAPATATPAPSQPPIVEVPDDEVPLGGNPQPGGSPTPEASAAPSPAPSAAATPEASAAPSPAPSAAPTPAPSAAPTPTPIIEVPDDEIPVGGSPVPDGPVKLPQTGEASPWPIYLAGGALIAIGVLLAAKFKPRK